MVKEHKFAPNPTDPAIYGPSSIERRLTGGIANGDFVNYQGRLCYVTGVQTNQGKASLRLDSPNDNLPPVWVELNQEKNDKGSSLTSQDIELKMTGGVANSDYVLFEGRPFCVTAVSCDSSNLPLEEGARLRLASANARDQFEGWVARSEVETIAEVA